MAAITYPKVVQSYTRSPTYGGYQEIEHVETQNPEEENITKFTPNASLYSSEVLPKSIYNCTNPFKSSHGIGLNYSNHQSAACDSYKRVNVQYLPSSSAVSNEGIVRNGDYEPSKSWETVRMTSPQNETGKYLNEPLLKNEPDKPWTFNTTKIDPWASVDIREKPSSEGQSEFELRQIISTLEKENKTLRQQASEWISEKTTLETELEELETKNSTLERVLEAATSMLNKSVANRAWVKLLHELREAHTYIMELEKDNKKYFKQEKEEVDDLNKKVNELQAELTVSKNERENLESRITILQSHIKELTYIVNNIEVNFDEEEGVDIEMKELGQAKNKLQLKEDDSSVSEEQLKSCKNLNTGKESKPILDTEKQGLDNAANHLQRTVVSVADMKEVDNLQCEQRYYSENADKENLKIVSLESEKTDEVKIDKLKGCTAQPVVEEQPSLVTSNGKEKVHRMKSKLKTTMSEKARLRTKLRVLTQQRKVMVYELSIQGKRIKELEGQVKAASFAVNSQLRSKIRGMEVKMKNHFLIEEELRTQISKNLDNIRTLEKKLEEMQSGTMELKEELKQSANESKKLEEEKQNLVDRSGLLETSLLENLSTNQSLQTKLQKSKSNEEDLEKQLGEVRTKLMSVEKELDKEKKRKSEYLARLMKNKPVIIKPAIGGLWDISNKSNVNGHLMNSVNSQPSGYGYEGKKVKVVEPYRMKYISESSKQQPFHEGQISYSHARPNRALTFKKFRR